MHSAYAGQRVVGARGQHRIEVYVGARGQHRIEV